DVASGCVDRMSIPSGRAIAPAIVRRTEMRPALQHFARNFDFRLPGIVTVLFAASMGIMRSATGVRSGAMRMHIPICSPLPYVADHVQKSISIGRENAHRRGALKTIAGKVLPGEFALPCIGHMPAIREQGITPCEFGSIKPPAGREFPFRFGGQ